MGRIFIQTKPKPPRKEPEFFDYKKTQKCKRIFISTAKKPRLKKPFVPRQTTLVMQRRFLAAFARCGVITEAARVAGCTSNAHNLWMNQPEKYPKYAKQFEKAMNKANDVLVKTCRSRAVDGWLEPVFYKGEKTGEVRRFSDTLLIFEMKRRMPEYRERYAIDGAAAQHLHLHQHGNEQVVVYMPDNGRAAPADPKVQNEMILPAIGYEVPIDDKKPEDAQAS